MIFRSSSTTATLLVLFATTAANFANAQVVTSQGLCPPESPVKTIAEREGGKCNFMSESCVYTLATGAPECPTNTNFQCRCGGTGLAYICSCRGDGAATPVAPIAPPTAAPVDPTAAPVDPTDAPVDPTAAPVDPTDAPVDPTAAPVDPTAAPVDPTAAPVDPTAAPVDPTDAPVVAPTDAPVDPTAAPVALDVDSAQAASGGASTSTNVLSTLMVSGAAAIGIATCLTLGL
jgi:hypothetical protein